MMIAALDRRRERRMGALRTARSQSALQEKSPSKSSRVQVAASKGCPLSPSNVATRKEAADAEQAAVEAAVARLVADPKADAAVAATALLGTVGVRMAARLGRDQRPSRRANRGHAAFGRNWEPRRSPRLLQARGDLKLHAAAIAALSRLADSQTISELARQETEKDLQRTLLASLLARGDAQALGEYLNYVQSEAMGDTALSAVDLVQNPPMDMLFSTLQSTQVLECMAAARVIGRIDGAATTRRLIAMVEQGTSRQEACVAPLSSRGEEAVNFVTNGARQSDAGRPAAGRQHFCDKHFPSEELTMNSAGTFTIHRCGVLLLSCLALASAAIQRWASLAPFPVINIRQKQNQPPPRCRRTTETDCSRLSGRRSTSRPRRSSPADINGLGRQ